MRENLKRIKKKLKITFKVCSKEKYGKKKINNINKLDDISHISPHLHVSNKIVFFFIFIIYNYHDFITLNE